MIRQPAFTAILSFLTLACLSSCSSIFPSTDLPTLIPTEQLPTVIALTSQAMIAQAASPAAVVFPSSTQQPPTPSPVLPDFTNTPQVRATDGPTPTASPSATPQPPFEIPETDIQILSPGALSKVASPISLHVFLTPGEKGRVRVELFGEHGRLMYRKLFVSTQFPGIQTSIRTDIDFEIVGMAEVAHLVVSVDDEYGRIKELSTQEIILLALGESDINPSGDMLAQIIIQEPAPEVLIQGNRLNVSGLTRTDPDHLLLVELITTDRKVIGNRIAAVASEPEGGHRLFAAEVPFEVESPTWVRVTVTERGADWPGIVQLVSTEILLSP